ncbi:hypothetical protein BGZ99_002433 [Dissophora globulifera]|uniref:Uncharacterized protein n=1 Tax=Dissophora globulifera TaxID=979702 RepID=A0A9P6RPM7_9FUNG|nr:hypothetical protein BGZ99_002433 [Dissophora globulifera]
MDKRPLDTASLIPLSLLSTSVFERSKKNNTSNTVAALQPSTHSTPITTLRTPASEPSFDLIIKKEPLGAQQLSTRPIEPVDMDPFVQGQSRRGRQQYEITGGRQRADSGDRNGRLERPTGSIHRGSFSGSSSKRRIQSPSPEPRKRPSTSSSYFKNFSPRSLSDSGGDSERDSGEQMGHRERHHKSTISEQTVVSFPESTRLSEKSRISQRQSENPLSSKSRRKRLRKANSGSSEDSSSSESSDSDSGSSDSDDYEQDRQLNGTSALKLHGIIHDLILDLERTRTKHAKYSEKVKDTSRKFRTISRKLERHFRDLSDTVMAVASPSERPPLASRSISDRAAVATVMQSGKKTQSYSGALPPSQQHLASSRKPSVSASALSSNISLAQTSDRFTIASANVVETFTNIHADVRNKAFGRKPRNMVEPSVIAGTDMDEVLVTSSLEGSIDFWDLEARRVMTSIPKSRLNQPWSEDMCWVGQNVLAVASAHKEGVSRNHQMMLIHVEKVKMPRATSAQNGASVSWTLQELKEMPHDPNKGGIMCMTSLGESASGFSVATAAMDKQIINWKFSGQDSYGNYIPKQQQQIHNRHTSTIQTLCYAPQSQILFSGGCDCKVIGWNMERSEAVVEFKSKDGRINSIVQNPVDPHLFLVCQALMSNQLSLHDNRMRFEREVLRFGFESADRLSKQILPSWHPGGAIVSSGMQSESKINLWDIRWRDVQRGAGQSIDVHEKRVFKAAFHAKRSFMTSMSSDGSLAFISIQGQ